MPKKSAKKTENRSKQKNPFFSLSNRWFVYSLILLGGIITDIGALLMNSEMKLLSYSLIAVGAILIIISLQRIAMDSFHITGYKQ